MTDSKAFKILQKGNQAWNEWRKNFPKIRPNLREARLEGAHLEGVNFAGVILWDAHLENAHLEGADFVLAELIQAHLEGAHLEGAKLWRAHLEGADLKSVSLVKAYLEAVHLEGANLEAANLAGAILVDAHLQGADFRSADLEGANLNGAHLEAAHLEKANLRNANLEGANLEGADLREANLEGAQLKGACLDKAHFDGAHLEGAHLEGADIRAANLEGAFLEVAHLEEMNCEVVTRIKITTVEDDNISLNCLVTFLYDLVNLHDRLLLILSNDYEYIQDFSCLRNNSPIKEGNQLQVKLITDKAPLEIELMVPSVTDSAVTIVPIGFVLVKIIDKAIEIINKRQNLGQSKVEAAERSDLSNNHLDNLLNMQEKDLPLFLRSKINKDYPKKTKEILQAMKQAVCLLINNRQIKIDNVSILEDEIQKVV